MNQRTHFYLSITATILLAISLSATAQESKDSSDGPVTTSTVKRDDSLVLFKAFNALESQCRTRNYEHPVKIDATCWITVKSKRCKGHCKSFTDFQLKPPFLVKNCSCCRPVGTIKYKYNSYDCREEQRSDSKKTGRKVNVGVPNDMECKCASCDRIISSLGR